MRIGPVAAIVIASVSGWGCDLLAPTCLGRQHRGTATEVLARIDAGQIIVHRLSYDTRGSQNDVEITWADQTLADGPRLRTYATKVGCETEPLPGVNGTGDCRILSSAGSLDSGNFASRLIVTHGRGNPEVLGTPPEFKVWIVGDPSRSALYTMTQTWFYGPDC